MPIMGQDLMQEPDNGTGLKCVTDIRNTLTTIIRFLRKMVTENCTIGYTGRRGSWREGDIEDDRKAALEKLLAKIEDVRKNQVDEANKKKERKQSEKEGIILDGKHTIVTKTAKPRKVNRKAVKQDDLWNHRWQAYMGYMKKNQFCPSRYYTEDMVLFSWFKHNKMLLSKGKMREYRIAKFKQLLDEVKELQRKNKDIINADNRKGFHIRARQRNWFEMCERYSKYLDDNKKIPKQNGDRQLYSWMFRQKRHLAEGDIKDNRKATLEKLLAKIEDVRKHQVDEANKKKEEIILDRKHALATKTTSPKKTSTKPSSRTICGTGSGRHTWTS